MRLDGTLTDNRWRKREINVYTYLRRYRWTPKSFEVAVRAHDYYELFVILKDGYIVARVAELDELWQYIHKPTFYGLPLRWLGYHTVVSPHGKKLGRPLEKENHYESA